MIHPKKKNRKVKSTNNKHQNTKPAKILLCVEALTP